MNFKRKIEILKKIDFDNIEEVKSGKITRGEIAEIKQFLSDYDKKKFSKTSKDDLKNIIESFYTQMVFVHRALDSLDVIDDAPKEAIDKSPNFFFITRKSLAYMCIVILASMLKKKDDKKEITVYAIIDMCLEHSDLFNDKVEKLCNDFKIELNNKNDIIKNFLIRRDKSLAHFEKDFFFLNQSACEKYKIITQDLREVANLTYQFADNLRDLIDKNPLKNDYPPNTDDLKRLFGQKTEAYIWLEGGD